MTLLGTRGQASRYVGTRRRGHRAPETAAAGPLGRRRTLSGLCDLGPADLTVLDPQSLRALVGPAGPGADVRLVLDDGERYLAAATAIADGLGCDVYLTPNGAVVQHVAEASPVATDVCDAVALDRATGAPVPWRVIRPRGTAAELPTWFNSVRGRLVPGTGLVTVALPDGLAFATRANFRAAATWATTATSTTGISTTGISTIVVGADLGRFEIGRFNDPGSLLGGVEFATLVRASLDALHQDVALALSWPASSTARSALGLELMRLADALDRTVWVPEQGATAGAGLVARDEQGEPARWRVYRSRLSVADSPRCGTDRSGRLVPLRGLRTDQLLPAREARVAGHGVPGLPDEVVHWPEVDQRADLPAYVLLPGAHRSGFVALHRTRPEFGPGQRVLEVKVRRRRVIDVPATVAAHGGAGFGGASSGFGGAGAEDLVLPAADLARAVVTKVWHYEDGRPVLNKLDRGTLADHLTPGRRFTAPDLPVTELVGV